MSAILLLWAALAAPARTSPEQAETLARRAFQQLAGDPAAAAESARHALRASSEFLPTDFVRAGRKGEVVEDAFRAARDAYRRHRGLLYRALGEAELALGRPVVAGRFLGRSELLDPAGGGWPALCAARLASGRPREALAVLLERARSALPTEQRRLAERIADAAGLPSLQAELDRARLLSLPEPQRPRLLGSPLAAPERARLSTGAPLRLDQPGLTLIYVADAGCRSCSADLLSLERNQPAGAQVYVSAADPSQDQALRQALRAYRYEWPVVVGASLPAAFDVEPPSLLVVARSGFTGLAVAPPFDQRLAPALSLLAREDLPEALPRPAWDRRPVARPVAVPQQPGLTPEGLAPGEDDEVPAGFSAGLAAFQAGRYVDALRAFEALGEADGWLLAPEARFDRALCLARLGRRDEARRLLLRIGDSRFQDAVDEALERVAGP